MSLNIGLLADFNTDNLVRTMTRQCEDLVATVTAAPYGQLMRTLLDPSVEFWKRTYDLIVVWASPTSIGTTFGDVVEFAAWSADDLHREVDQFADLVRGLDGRTRNVFVPSWVAPAGMAHRPSIEMNGRLGTTAALLRMNVWLIDRLGAYSNIVVFNTDRWIRQGGSNALSDKLWYMSKTPYSKIVFEEAAMDMAATLRGLIGLRRKVVILDLDNTVWGGVVGDVGSEGIRLGGHDPVGEAFLQFQRELQRLAGEGVLLAVVSKNEEVLALDAIDNHPEMALRSRNLAAWRINWADKAQNIVELMAELNLDVDSAIFIDDSEHERNRVRQALPNVFVPDWPSDPMDYARALRALRCFESSSISIEDRARTTMYASDRERKKLQTDVGSLDEWLATLGLEVTVDQLSLSNLERTAQLLNKTNQMNLTTRRMSAPELAAWAAEDQHRVWTFRVRDRFGDYGLCGIASLVLKDSYATLVDFVLSCRVMGRGVENAILSVVAKKVRDAGVEQLAALYLPTAKNRPCLRWIEQQAWFKRRANSDTFLLDVNREIAAPSHIGVIMAS